MCCRTISLMTPLSYLTTKNKFSFEFNFSNLPYNHHMQSYHLLNTDVQYILQFEGDTGRGCTGGFP